MPRLFHVLAILAPLVAIAYIFRTFDVAAQLALSWPLALHPDTPGEAAQVYISPQYEEASKGDAVHGSVHEKVKGDVKGFSRRIVAVGDLHGDLPNALRTLRMAGVVDKDGHWSGDVDFFVQTGDIIDRGDDTIKLYAWMDQLRDEATAKGGHVMSHMGNHEWMNVIGDWRYVRPSEIETFGGSASRMRAITSGHLGASWAANYSTCSRLPYHPSLGGPNDDFDPSSPSAQSSISHAAISFVHGGLAPNYPELTPYPSRINKIGSSLLRKLQTRNPQPRPHPPHPYPGLPHEATIAEQRLYGSDGPLWYRGWALEPESKVCHLIDDVLKRTGTRRMVMGHTPNFEKIVSRCNGKIIIIDTGISHAYGGILSALSIKYSLTPLPDNKWKERELITAVYADRQDVLAVTEHELVGDFTN